MNTAETASDAQLGLPADLGIDRIADTRAQLSPLHDVPCLRIDASAVSRIHGATLQLLAAFCRDRNTAGHRTRWQAPSRILRDAVRQLALTPHLQIEEN